MKLDFKITEKNNAIADGTVTWPIHLGALSLISKAGREKARDAQRVVQITATFQELSDRRTLDCSDASRQPGDKRARTYPITGNVGIGELVDQYFQIPSRDDCARDRPGYVHGHPPVYDEDIGKNQPND